MLKFPLITNKLNFKILKAAIQAVFILCLSVLAYAPLSHAQYFGWEINQFNTDLQINQDSSIDITETIQADFTKSSYTKHGIKRYIPIKYQDKHNQILDLRFTLNSVTDEKGNNYEYEQSFSGDKVYLKIGSGDIDVQGQNKTYLIKYRLNRGLNQFEGYDEFFWNSTGLDWDANILKSTTTIKLPKPAEDISKIMAKCFTGSGYSTNSDCQATVLNSSTIEYTTNQTLSPGQGISVVVGFPHGLVNFPTSETVLLWFVQDNWGYSLPFLTLFFMLGLWFKYGKDPKANRSTIMPEYEAPDQLSPAEIGTLIDDRVDTRDITSTIIDLATRGYLKIEETKEKKLLWDSTVYTLIKTIPKTTPKNALKTFEKEIYDALFSSGESVTMEDLKYKFYKSIPSIQKKIYAQLIEDKYYSSSPDSARNKYFGIGGSAFFIILFFVGPFADFNLALLIGSLISSGIIFAFGFIMPKKNQKGADTLIRILGLEEFIKTAETDRLKFYEKENIFEKILPYAIALGLADKWAKACEGIMKTQPEWYSGNTPGSFNTFYFVNSLNSFNNNISQSITTAPRSSSAGGSSGFGGGGFSGGGFGGGGGSSW